jgi:hypothetical protein
MTRPLSDEEIIERVRSRVSKGRAMTRMMAWIHLAIHLAIVVGVVFLIARLRSFAFALNPDDTKLDRVIILGGLIGATAGFLLMTTGYTAVMHFIEGYSTSTHTRTQRLLLQYYDQLHARKDA